MTKLENLCERLTGIDPRTIEPKPSSRQLVKWLRAARGERSTPPELVSPRITTSYTLVETDLEHGVDGHSDVPFSVISRTLPNGTTEHAFVWGQSLGPDEVSTAALCVPKSDWFELNENQQL